MRCIIVPEEELGVQYDLKNELFQFNFRFVFLEGHKPLVKGRNVFLDYACFQGATFQEFAEVFIPAAYHHSLDSVMQVNGGKLKVAISVSSTNGDEFVFRDGRLR